MGMFDKQTQENQWAAVFGSSATMWSWWYDLEFIDGADWNVIGPVILEIEDPEDETKTIRKQVTPARIFTSLYKCKKEIPSFKGLDMDDPDLDAGTADCVLQMAVLGEVVYG